MAPKVCILIWKDLLYRRNNIIVTLLELLLPISFMVLVNLKMPLINRGRFDHYRSETISFESKLHAKCNFVTVSNGWGNFVYEPSNPFLRELLNYTACQLNLKRLSFKPGVVSKNEAVKMQIKFEGMGMNQTTVPESLKYTIYPTEEYYFSDADKLWQDQNTHHSFSYTKEYNDLLFIKLKYAIDISFLYMKNITKVTKLEIGKMKIPFETEMAMSMLEIFMPSLIMMMYFFSNVVVISTLVQEKISGSKELLLMMGVKRWQIWLAKFFDAMWPLSIIGFTVVLLLHVSFSETEASLQVVKPIDSSIVFLLGTIAIVALLFFLSSIFKNVMVVILVISGFWIVIFVGTLVTSYLVTSKSVALLKCLIPQFAIIDGAKKLAEFEAMRKVVKYNERLSNKPETLTLAEILLMMILDIVLYSFLTWYLEQVRPGPFGIPQSPIFLFKKSYWIPSKVVDDPNLKVEKDIEFIEEARGLTEGISVQNVSKIYKKHLKKDAITAVNNVSIDFYENEITGLLGHNGAGKTTLISIICGLTPSTSGRVLVNGFDVAKNPSDARRSLGLCPQHDLLFNNLTAIENVAFYGMIKGLSKRKAYEEARDILRKFRMDHVRKTKAGKLSGGQKRKVSLAIALAGDSKVIVLDEPTSGLDPEFRREIWDLLLPLRGSKTVILTTHFMEEADALCNRIAIMDLGKIKCFATPMVLKSKYGTGYTLSVVATDLGKVPKIKESIKGTIKTSAFKSQNALTLYFTLPEAEMPNFPALFDNLDNKKTAHEIVTYSLNISTLEDVFLKVSHDASKKNGVDTVDASPYRRFSTDELQTNKYSTRLIIFCQILALFWKKAILLKRKLSTFIILNGIIIGLVVLELYAIENLSKLFSYRGDEEQKDRTNLTIPFSLDIYPKWDVLLDADKTNEIATPFRNLIKKHGSNVKEVKDVTKAYINLYFEDYIKYISLLYGVEMHESTTIYHNVEAPHLAPIAINLFSNAYLKGNESIESAIGLDYLTENYYSALPDIPPNYWDLQPSQPGVPLPPQDPSNYHRRSANGNGHGGDYNKCPLDSFTFWPTIIAFFFFIGPLQERSHGAKHLQLMITPVMIYWITHLIFDLIIFLIIVAILFVLYGCAKKELFTIMKANTGLISTVIVLWSIALLLSYYAITTFLKSPKGTLTFGLLFFLIGFMFQKLVLLDEILKQLSYMHPSILTEWTFDELCKTGKAPQLPGLGIYCVCMFTYLVLKDSKILGTMWHKAWSICCKVRYKLEYRKDTEVEVEEENVTNIIHGNDIPSKVLVVEDLRRWFFSKCKKFPAVKGISFSVNHGECFGLLGVNGAGKTSTFSMLTGELVASGGKAYVNGVPLFNMLRRSQALSKIGYCPQSGGFIPCFSCTENLMLFGKLRGIRCSLVRREVRRWIEKMNLEPHRKKMCLQLSGGNQRKLATAIALIGDSPLIFLDEPTTGVDPGGRRSIWNLISELREEGQSVVLTSHSMDECEALCTRLTIMVKGQLCCIGETAVLKDKFGQGYSVLVKITVDSTDEDREKLKNEMAAQFDPGCNLTDEHLTMLQYHITNASITWKKLFVKLSDIKKKFRFLESYSASATTLEQLFLYFARNQ